jgi:hypothetical protein
MIPYIILSVLFIVSLISLFWLFDKLTPGNIPNNLKGHFRQSLINVIIALVSIFLTLFIVQLIFG